MKKLPKAKQFSDMKKTPKSHKIKKKKYSKKIPQWFSIQNYLFYEIVMIHLRTLMFSKNHWVRTGFVVVWYTSIYGVSWIIFVLRWTNIGRVKSRYTTPGCRKNDCRVKPIATRGHIMTSKVHQALQPVLPASPTWPQCHVCTSLNSIEYKPEGWSSCPLTTVGGGRWPGSCWVTTARGKL